MRLLPGTSKGCAFPETRIWTGILAFRSVVFDEQDVPRQVGIAGELNDIANETLAGNVQGVRFPRNQNLDRHSRVPICSLRRTGRSASGRDRGRTERYRE